MSGAAVVTGAASGIGRALAEALAARGAPVTLADRQAELAEEVAGGIRRRGGSADAAELDVRDAARFRAVVDHAAQAAGSLAYLFNNAGIGVAGEMSDYEAADWDDVIDVNLRGVAHGVLAAYPRMIRQGFGHIVNTASMAGLITTTFQGSYTTTKHAVVGLSKALRLEARQHGVRVSVLCPGVIRTPILQGGRYGRLKLDLDPDATAQRFEPLRPMDPALLARRTLAAMDRNRAVIIEPRWWRLFWYLERLSPALGERLGRISFQRMQRELESLRRTRGPERPSGLPE
jgi:NAD(P)-dependent dehydrogenase (short-subunit alcohol dehydrogenase family)